MYNSLKLIAVSGILFCSLSGKAQNKISIPAFTAYAVPAEQINDNDESTLFGENGLQHWADEKQSISFYFRIRTKGVLDLSLLIRNISEGNKLTATIAGSSFIVKVPRSDSFKPVKIGSVNIRDTGSFVLTLNCLEKKGNTIADIRSLDLSGSAVKNIHFNANPRRNAASVHLFYPDPDSIKVLSFYNEVTIPINADIIHSYYMACGFARGYFGIQVNSPTERRVIFSVWDAGNEAVDRNKVSEENKVKLIAKGENVYADGFGNEGTGGHSHWVYNWKAGETYRFLVTAVTDSATNSTNYTGYFFIPELQQWKLIACFKAPRDGRPLRSLYSFVENFDGSNGQLFRKAYFGNQWIRRDNGKWLELTSSRFSYDATGKAGNRIDYGGGVDSNRFFLWNGAFGPTTTKFGDNFNRKPNQQKPVVDLYRNADSVVTAKLEGENILQAIKAGKLEITGQKGDLYYTILREGTGDPVRPEDTIVVNYRGTLLNGALFDESKDKPAIFPLKRLIRGMQMGMLFCKAGGKIRLIMPSALAYGTRDLGIISPNSTLVFEVEVLDIKRGKP